MTETITVSDFMVQHLHDWGIRRIFGYPGDGINGILGALQKVQDSETAIDFVQVRHEAVFSAPSGENSHKMTWLVK